jgi:hypothetical protein
MSSDRIDEITSKFEGKRVRLLFDSWYPASIYLLNHYLPVFSSKRKIFVAFTDLIWRNFELLFEKIGGYEDTYVIKIGHNDDIRFGELYEYIPLSNDAESVSERLSEILEKLKIQDVVIFLGFYMGELFYGDSISNFNQLKVYSFLPEGITLLRFDETGFYKEVINHFIRRLHDLEVIIKREDELYSFGEEVYTFGISQTLFEELPSGYARVRVENGRLVEI